MNNNCCMRQTDYGPNPCILRVEEMAEQIKTSVPQCGRDAMYK